MIQRPLFTTLLIAASAALPAQNNVYVPDNNAATGACNIIPFGSSTLSATWQNQKYQSMITTTDIGANVQVASICDLGFAPCVAGIRHFDTIEIVMGQTKATTLSTTYSANLVTNVQTVLKAENYDWHNDTNNTWNRIGLDKDYVYLQSNGNVVVQITVTGAVLNTTRTGFPGYHNANRQRIFSISWSAGTPPTVGSSGNAAAKIELVVRRQALNDFGLGCKGSNGVPDLHLSGDATIGTGTVDISVSNCPTNNALLQVFGLSRFATPVDLAFAGAPGCKLYQTPDIILGGATSATGTYRFSGKIPNDRSLVCLRIYTQAFPNDPTANSWKRTSSNFGRILPGL